MDGRGTIRRGDELLSGRVVARWRRWRALRNLSFFAADFTVHFGQLATRRDQAIDRFLRRHHAVGDPDWPRAVELLDQLKGLSAPGVHETPIEQRTQTVVDARRELEQIAVEDGEPWRSDLRALLHERIAMYRQTHQWLKPRIKATRRKLARICKHSPEVVARFDDYTTALNDFVEASVDGDVDRLNVATRASTTAWREAWVAAGGKVPEDGE